VSKVLALDWKREVGPRYPGEVNWVKSEVQSRRPDTVLLEKAVDMGLGRPSTWAKHVEGFMKQGLVDDKLGLTALGARWVAGSPPLLLDPRISAAIERACEQMPRNMLDDPEREPWELLAESIVSRLPPELSNPLRAMVANEPAHPKYDPAREFSQRELGREDPEMDSALINRIDDALTKRLTLEME
jgi:DNA topoisomerase-1